MSSEFTVRELRDAFGQFGTGVTVITAVGPRGEPVGITANSLTSVSLDPPLLLWCLANKSSSTGAFAWQRRFNVHFLAEDQEDLAMQYARPSHEKFEAGNGEDEPEDSDFEESEDEDNDYNAENYFDAGDDDDMGGEQSLLGFCAESAEADLAGVAGKVHGSQSRTGARTRARRPLPREAGGRQREHLNEVAGGDRRLHLSLQLALRDDRARGAGRRAVAASARLAVAGGVRGAHHPRGRAAVPPPCDAIGRALVEGAVQAGDRLIALQGAT